MSQMSGTYSTELLERQASRPAQSWFSRFGPRLKQAIIDAPTDPAAIARYLDNTGAIEPADRRGKVSDAARTPTQDPFEPKIDDEEARFRQLAGRMIVGEIDMKRADVSGAADPYTALADKILVKQSKQTLEDPLVSPEAALMAGAYVADYEARNQAARLGGEAAIAQASPSPAELPARYVQLWSQGYTDDEIQSLMRDTWANLDEANAQKMMDRLEIEADILQDQGKLVEAQGVLRARRSLIAKSPINVDANARPYDVLLDQMIQHDVKRGGKAGAFQAAGSDAFLSTVRGIGRLLNMVPDNEKDYLERLTAASYNEHPVTSFAGSFAGGMADPIFFGLSMAIAKAPVTAASRARYAQDMIKTGVPTSVANEAAAKLTTEELAVHRLSRYFLNNEKALRAAGVVTRGAPISENTARALAQITWNAADGMVSNALAEGVVSWSEHDSPATIAIRMAQGGVMGLGLGTALGGLFSGAAAIGRVISRKLPPDTQRALNIASNYVATGADDAPQVRTVVEESVRALKQASDVKGERLTDDEARALLAEIGVDIDELRGLGRQRMTGPREARREIPSFEEIESDAPKVEDSVVDAGEIEGSFEKTPETVEESIVEAIPDADASMAANLAEEATAHRSALAELAETRRQLAEASAEARTDPLTKLSNRRGLEEGSAAMLARSDETGKPVSVVMFDMSNFKALNDVHGHEKGDEALEIIAKVIDEEIRSKPDPERGRTEADLDVAGLAARPGGDEFLAMLYDTDDSNVWAAINRVEQRVEYELEQAGLGHIDTTRGRRRVRLIGGVSVRAAGSEATLEQLINAADQASIARKAEWKRIMREPEGRFELSEVVNRAAEPESEAADVPRDPDRGDSEPGTGEPDLPDAEASALGDEAQGGEAGPQRSLFPELQQTIDDLESRERDLIGFREKFPEVAHVPDEELEQAFEANLDLTIEYVDNVANAPRMPKLPRDPEKRVEALQDYLVQLDDSIKALDWPISEPESAFREADPDIWVPGDLDGAAYNDLEREMFVRSSEEVGRLAQAMQDGLKKKADDVEAELELLGRNLPQIDEPAFNPSWEDPLDLGNEDIAGVRQRLGASLNQIYGLIGEKESQDLAHLLTATQGNGPKLAKLMADLDDVKAKRSELRARLQKMMGTSGAGSAMVDSKGFRVGRGENEKTISHSLMLDVLHDVRIAELRKFEEAQRSQPTPRGEPDGQQAEQAPEAEEATGGVEPAPAPEQTPTQQAPAETGNDGLTGSDLDKLQLLPESIRPSTDSEAEAFRRLWKSNHYDDNSAERILDHYAGLVAEGERGVNIEYVLDQYQVTADLARLGGWFESRVAGLNGREAGDAATLLSELDELYRRGDESELRGFMIERLIDVYPEIRSQIDQAKYYHLGERLLDNIEDLDPSGNKADAAAIRAAFKRFAKKRGAKKGEIPNENIIDSQAFEDLAQVAKDKLAKARHTAAREEYIQIPTNMADMAVWAFDEASESQVRKIVAEAEKIASQYEGGKIPAGDKAKKLIQPPKKAPKAGKIGKIVGREAVQKRMLSKFNKEDRRLIVTGEGNLVMVGKFSVAQVVMPAGEKLPDTGIYKAEGVGVSKTPMSKAELGRMDMQAYTSPLSWPKVIHTAKLGDGSTLRGHLLRANTMLDDTNPSAVLVQNPDGSLGVVASSNYGSMASGAHVDAELVAVVNPRQMLDGLELMMATTEGEIEMHIGIPPNTPAKSGQTFYRFFDANDSRTSFVGMGQDDAATGKEPRDTTFGKVMERKKTAAPKQPDAGQRPDPIAPNQIQNAPNPDRIKKLSVRPSAISAIDPSGGTNAPASKIPSEISKPAVTPKAKKLIDRIKADPEGKSVGIRSIREWLSDEMGVLELMRREQTGKKHPAHYMRDAHLIRSRNPSAAWLFHEHGHALSAMIRENHPNFLNVSKPAGKRRKAFVNPVADKALDLVQAQGSMASANSPEEGFAEWARLYITQPDRLLALDPRETITKAVRKAEPEMMELFDDAARAYREHMQRPLKSRWRAHQNDINKSPKSVRGLLRGSMVRYGSRGLAGKFAVDDVLKIINKDADSISEGWRKVARVERAIRDTGGNVEVAYNGLLHIDQLTGIALQGMKEDGSGGGLRVHAMEEIPSLVPDEHKSKAKLGGLIDHEGNIAALREGGFKIDDELERQLRNAKHGDMIIFNNRSVHEIIQPVKDNFGDFEAYAQMKATVSRKLVRKGFDFQTQSEGTSFMDLITTIAKDELEHPEYKRVFDELQDVMDKTLLIDVMSGESTVENAVTLRNTFEHYLPLTRIGERGSPRVNIGPTTSPTSGIRRSRGSENAAEPVLAAIHRKIAQSINAYYWNAYMTAPIRFAETIAKQADIPVEAKRAAKRIMLPLALDTKKMVDLSEGEQQSMIAEWMRKKAYSWLMNEKDGVTQLDVTEEEIEFAKNLDTTNPENEARAKEIRARMQAQRVDQGWDFSIPPELAAQMRPADVNLVYPGKIPVFRKVKPNALNVVAPMISGRRRYYQINDPLLFEVFAGGEGIGDVVRFADRLVGQMTQPWKNSITQTATFALRSLARDYPTAMAMGVKMGDYKALIPGYYHVLGAMTMLTGKTPETLSTPEILSRTFRHIHSEDFVKQRSKLRRELYGELIPRGWKDMSVAGRLLSAPGIAVRVILRPVEIFQALTGQRAIATLAETAPRIGAFVSAKARGLNDMQAQHAADTITGYFAERPLSDNASQIYRMAGFVNPATQISSQFAQILLDPVPARAAAKIGVLSGAVATVSAIVWGLKELLQTDEDRQREMERTEQERLTHMDIRGLRIPFDYGFAGGIQSFVYNTLDIYAGGLPPVDRRKLATKILTESLPPQMLAPWELLPPIGRAGLEATTNYSFYRGRSLVPDYMTYLEPGEQAFTTTPEIYRWFGAVTNQSPAMIEHMVRNGISVKLADMIRAVDRADKGLLLDEMANLPEIGRMFTREPQGWNSRSVETVQELDRKYENLRKKIEAMKDDPTVDPAVLFELKQDLRQYQFFHTAMLKIERTYKQSKGADPERREIMQRKMVEIAQKAIEKALDDEGE